MSYGGAVARRAGKPYRCEDAAWGGEMPLSGRDEDGFTPAMRAKMRAALALHERDERPEWQPGGPGRRPADGRYGRGRGTPTEKELRAVFAGHTVEEAAAALGISPTWAKRLKKRHGL